MSGERQKYKKSGLVIPEMDAPLRTHADFVAQNCPRHHLGTTDLLKIPGIDVSKQFVLDILHLGFLGVVKKMLNIWVNGNSPPGKFSVANCKLISERLFALRPYVPCEFQRKPRGLDEKAFWKGTEFKFFLLFAGPIVLIDVLPQEHYRHFITLTLAIMILSSPKLLKKQLDASRQFLKKNFRKFIELYGEKKCSYNIHSLLHLADDCENFDDVNNFSAFPFESAMPALTKLVRKKDRVLQQVANRLGESSLILVKPPKDKKDELRSVHSKGPMIPGFLAVKQFKSLQLKNMKFSLNLGDKCCKVGKDVVFISNICQDEARKIFIVCQKLKSVGDLFDKPWPSSSVGIRVFEHKKAIGLKLRPFEDILEKLVALPFNKKRDQYVVFPLPHLS